jgi:hypothetical protein
VVLTAERQKILVFFKVRRNAIAEFGAAYGVRRIPSKTSDSGPAIADDWVLCCQRSDTSDYCGNKRYRGTPLLKTDFAVFSAGRDLLAQILSSRADASSIDAPINVSGLALTLADDILFQAIDVQPVFADFAFVCLAAGCCDVIRRQKKTTAGCIAQPAARQFWPSGIPKLRARKYYRNFLLCASRGSIRAPRLTTTIVRGRRSQLSTKTPT